MASTTRKTGKGISLAKGPVALLGAAMLAFGIISLLLGGNSFTSDAPSGTVNGDTFLGVEGNGWTNLLWIAGGALLLFGAPLHWGAKTMALVVGLALGAASLINIIDGTDVLGIFAGNGWTELLWGAASVFLLITALLPRVGGKKEPVEHGRDREVAQPVRPETRTGEAADRHVAGEGDPRNVDRDRSPSRDDDGLLSRETAREDVSTKDRRLR